MPISDKPPVSQKEPPPTPVTDTPKDTKTGANTSNRIQEREALSDKIEDEAEKPPDR